MVRTKGPSLRRALSLNVIDRRFFNSTRDGTRSGVSRRKDESDEAINDYAGQQIGLISVERRLPRFIQRRSNLRNAAQ